MNQARTIRTFYILVLTQTFSMLGSHMTSFAIGIQVFKDTEAVTPLALVAFFSMLPRVFLAGVAGVLADRWDRRKVMILSDAGQAVGTVLLLISFASGYFELWHLYVVTIIQALFSIFQGPAFSASVTMLVPDQHRDRANAIQHMRGPAAGLLAPMIASLLFITIGVTGVILIDLVTFLVAVTVVAMVHIPRPPQTAEGLALRGSMWKEALAGYKMLWDRRMIFYLMLFAMYLNFLFNMIAVMLTPYILTLTNSEATLGLVSGLFQAGIFAGAIVMSVWRFKGKRIHLIMPTILITTVFLMVFGMVRQPVLLAIVAFLMLLPNAMTNVPITSLLQLKIPPDVQGRVFAAVNQLSMLASPLGALAGGPLADYLLEPAVGTAGWSLVDPLVGSDPGAGMGLLMVINGGLALAMGIALYTWPRMRRMEEELPDYAPTASVIEDQSQEDNLQPDFVPSPA